MRFADRVRQLYEEMGYAPARRFWIDSARRQCCPVSILAMNVLLKRGQIGDLNEALDNPTTQSFYALMRQVFKHEPFLRGFTSGWDGAPNQNGANLDVMRRTWPTTYQKAYDAGYRIGSSLRQEIPCATND